MINARGDMKNANEFRSQFIYHRIAAKAFGKVQPRRAVNDSR
jgi:hypothetical protein